MLRCIASLCLLLVALLGTGCASYSGSGLRLGESSLDDVLRVMGKPAMLWAEPNGRKQLSYPRGPYGVHSYMVHMDTDGHLLSVENVMHAGAFSRIVPGMSQADVLRVLGPSEPGWSAYYKARDELVWEWRYCDVWSKGARFNVLFDSTSGLVRSSMSRHEECGKRRCDCGR